MEIYALEIQMYTAQKNNKKLKELYEQSLHIKSAIPHPLIMGVIRGKLNCSYVLKFIKLIYVYLLQNVVVKCTWKKVIFLRLILIFLKLLKITMNLEVLAVQRA